jgi:hypothetical protein
VYLTSITGAQVDTLHKHLSATDARPGGISARDPDAAPTGEEPAERNE